MVTLYVEHNGVSATAQEFPTRDHAIAFLVDALQGADRRIVTLMLLDKKSDDNITYELASTTC